MDGYKEVCNGWSMTHSHCNTRNFVRKYVTKFHPIVSHDQFNSFNECIRIIVPESNLGTNLKEIGCNVLWLRTRDFARGSGKLSEKGIAIDLVPNKGRLFRSFSSVELWINCAHNCSGKGSAHLWVRQCWLRKLLLRWWNLYWFRCGAIFTCSTCILSLLLFSKIMTEGGKWYLVLPLPRKRGAVVWGRSAECSTWKNQTENFGAFIFQATGKLRRSQHAKISNQGCWWWWWCNAIPAGAVGCGCGVGWSGGVGCVDVLFTIRAMLWLVDVGPWGC